MTTTSIIAALTALSCDAYTVTATVREGRIVASYRAKSSDLGQAEHDGADASARIAEVLKPAGYSFSDAGADDPGIYEVWTAAMSRKISISAKGGAWAGSGVATWKPRGVEITDCAAVGVPFEGIEECIATYHAEAVGHVVECETSMGVWNVTLGARAED